MKQHKHSFEAVSLLTTRSGLLELTVVSATGQPNWLIPTSLILDVIDFDEFIWTYLWKKQDVSVYHLIDRTEKPNKIVILEGNTAVHRIALQINGELKEKSVRISDVKDITNKIEVDVDNANFNSDYIFQFVKLDDETLIVPDLDLISHKLVDLDS